MSSLGNRENLGANISAFNGDFSDANRQLEPARPRASGIEVENALPGFLFWNVTVARDYNAESCGFGFEVESSEIVKHVDGNPAKLDDCRMRQSAGPLAFVDIPPHRCNRSEGCQLVEDLGIACVSSMNDVVGSAQSVERFRTKQAVGVGDDADEDGSSQF